MPVPSRLPHEDAQSRHPFRDEADLECLWRPITSRHSLFPQSPFRELARKKGSFAEAQDSEKEETTTAEITVRVLATEEVACDIFEQASTNFAKASGVK